MTCARNIPLVLLITVLVAGGPAHACTPPERPFLPASREDMRAYADLIRGDFEAYSIRRLRPIEICGFRPARDRRFFF